MSITIRPAMLMDLEDLHKIEIECFKNEAFTKLQISYFLRSQDFVSLVALVNNEIAGFIIGAIEPYSKTRLGHIYTINVLKKYRRRGVASNLLSAMEKILDELGIETCYLEARADNVAALELYRKHGYKITNTIRDYYNADIDGVQLKKHLHPMP